MSKFDVLLETFLAEYNVTERDDPEFYDYVVVLIQQLKKRGFVGGSEPFDIRVNARRAIRNEFINIVDPLSDFSYKIEFLFNTNAPDVSNLSVRIVNLLDPAAPVKVIDNTHEETSTDEICDYLEIEKTKQLQQKENPVETVPTPGTVSALPNAENAPVVTAPEQGAIAQGQSTANYLPQPKR